MHVRPWLCLAVLWFSVAPCVADAKTKGEVQFKGGFPVTTRSAIYPVSKIERGQKGIGYTVLAEDEITEFGVEVLGIMHGILGPKQPLNPRQADR